MTCSSTFLRNIAIAVMAVLYTTLTIGAAVTPTSAMARDNSIHYRVELAQPATETSAIAAGVAWSCSGTSCVAKKASSRPINACKKFVRELGPVTSFTAKGKALSAEKLAKCNGE